MTMMTMFFWEYIGENNVIKKCGRGFDDTDEDYEEETPRHTWIISRGLNL